MSTRPQLRRPLPKGLAQGESLARAPLLSTTTFSEWGWVGTEVLSAADIGPQHRAAACGFRKHACKNRHAPVKPQSSPLPDADSQAAEDDIVVISSDDEPECSPKVCKTNPNCCNYVGQQKWENEGTCFLLISLIFGAFNMRLTSFSTQTVYGGCGIGSGPSRGH